MSDIKIELGQLPKELQPLAGELPSAVKSGWGIFTLKSFGANIKRGNKVNETTVWASLETPDPTISLIAIPLHPGAGPQPENTLTLVEVHDMITEVVRSLEWALANSQEQVQVASDPQPNQSSW